MAKRNDIDTMNYREVTRSDWYRMFLYILAYSAMLIIVSILLLPGNWLPWLAVIALGTFLLIEWHTKNFAYQCPNCGKRFEISVASNFLGPNGGTRKYLKCPECGKRSWARILVKKK